MTFSTSAVRRPALSRPVVREAFTELVATAFLLIAVVGSGIMAEKLCAGNVGLALLANAIATGGALVALILAFGPQSGAHMNPVVTLAAAATEGLRWHAVPAYVVAQIVGGMVGVWLAHVMFGLPVWQFSQHVRTGLPLWVAEVIATFGLLTVIWGCRAHREPVTAVAVGAYITGAYWFTASTSFANPAVTIARSLSDTLPAYGRSMRLVLSSHSSLASPWRFRCCAGPKGGGPERVSQLGVPGDRHPGELSLRFMAEKTELRTRAGTIADAAAIAEIYNQGIVDRVATFETEPRSAADIAGWFTQRHLVVVAETGETGPVAFAASFPYSSRACYSGIGEFSVYVRRDYRGRGAGRAALAALIEAVAARGMHKLTSRVFPENAASRALLKGLGFQEIGVHRRHGQLDGGWRDCVIVELLLPRG
jgi:L-amino acid N-acyltransferase YncA/glycerol uptake facilitator-like aquaporin